MTVLMYPLFQIRFDERENAGSYECVASNNLPPDVSREMIVTVHCKLNVLSRLC
jgi:hypothetical protein